MVLIWSSCGARDSPGLGIGPEWDRRARAGYSALPLGGGKLPGFFKKGTSLVGETVGIAGETLSGPELAAAFENHLGRPVTFYDMPFDDYRALGFPGADDMGNMYQWQAIVGDAFLGYHSTETARAHNPELLDFDA